MNIRLHIAAVMLEVLGTVWLLVAVWRAHRLARHELNNMDTLGPVGNAIRDTLAGRYKNQWPGFAFLIIGLLIDSIAIVAH